MPRRPRGHEDPLAADRRTLVVAAVAMVALIAVGVASAALFTGSACDVLAGGSVPAGAAGTEVRQVIDETFRDHDESVRDAIVDGVSELAGRLGAVEGIAAVDGQRLTTLSTGPAVLGPTTTVLGPDGASVRAAGTFGEPATVVGAGDTLFSLALVNELTGQIDAVQSLDVALEPAGACLDTATVNVPFAFHLDAGDGQLLVFRVEEDGDEPELELRDRDGARWQAPVEVATAPPGLLGERLSGRLGDELVVAGRRVLPTETAAAITAVARDDGSARWSLAPDELPLGDGPTWLEVVSVDADAVLMAVREGDEPDTGTRLLALDPADGSVRWSDDEVADRVRVVASPGTAVVDLVRSGEQLEVHHLDVATGERDAVGSLAATAAHGAAIDGGTALALGEAGVAVVGADGVWTQAVGIAAVDIVADDGRTSVLLADDEASVVVTFGST